MWFVTIIPFPLHKEQVEKEQVCAENTFPEMQVGHFSQLRVKPLQVVCTDGSMWLSYCLTHRSNPHQATSSW